MSDEELTSLVREAYFNANKDYIDEQIEIALKKLEHIENVEKQISNILIRNRNKLRRNEVHRGVMPNGRKPEFYVAMPERAERKIVFLHGS